MVEVYKRGNSPFWYFDLPDPRAPGGRRRKSTKRTKKGEAQAVARAEEQKVLDRDQLGALEEPTLYEAVSHYVRSVQRKADYPNIVGRARKLVGRTPEGAPEAQGEPKSPRWHFDFGPRDGLPRPHEPRREPYEAGAGSGGQRRGDDQSRG